MPDVTPAATRWFRLAAIALGASLAAAASIAARVGATGNSPGAGAAAVVAAFAAAGSLGLALGPTRWQRPFWNAWRAMQQRLQVEPVEVSRAIGLGLMAAGAIAYVLIVMRLMSFPQDPWDDDQGAFLLTARDIHEQGGWPWLWRALWSGEFAEANRHPLYLALLSLCPTVRGGQWLSASIGAAAFVVLTGITARRYGRFAAGVFSVLLGTNGAFCLFSTRVVCEILLVLLCGLAWLIHIPTRGQSAASVISPLRCTAAGALLGLVWLTKGTGLVLFLAYCLWIVVVAIRGPESTSSTAATESGQVRQRTTFGKALAPLACAVAAFGIISLPLLVRNTIRFGDPVHNLNSLLLFADQYDDLAGMVDRQWTTGQAARAWWATHSVADVLRREASGLVWEAFIFLRSLGPAPLDDARLLVGLPLAVLALGLLIARPTAAGGLLAAWGAISWFMFAWYVPIAAGERFILPLLAPTLILASAAIARACRGLRAPYWGLVVGIVWAAIWVASAWLSDGFGKGNS